MQVAVEIPDAMAGALKEREPELSRALLEAYAAEAYRKKELSRGQVRRLLGMDFFETEKWFADRGIERDYTIEDLEQDRRTIEALFPHLK
jgi:predicted HTH domain antitoxin